MDDRTVVATDGSSLGNPGPSGWAWVCADGRQDWASARHSTNNRMELMAVRELLRSISDHGLLIQADSQYVIKVFTEWLPGWRARRMRTASKKPVENAELILEIADLLADRDVEWQWVRGHVGHELNEKADTLARHGAERAKHLAELGSLPDVSADPPRISDR